MKSSPLSLKKRASWALAEELLEDVFKNLRSDIPKILLISIKERIEFSYWRDDSDEQILYPQNCLECIEDLLIEAATDHPEMGRLSEESLLLWSHQNSEYIDKLMYDGKARFLNNNDKIQEFSFLDIIKTCLSAFYYDEILEYLDNTFPEIQIAASKGPQYFHLYQLKNSGLINL